MVPRLQKTQLEQSIQSGKILLLNGPRKAGKLQLLQIVLSENRLGSTHFDCSDKAVRKGVNIERLCEVETPVIVLEEAQYLTNLQQILEAVLGGNVQATVIACCSFTPDVDEMLLEAMRMEGLQMDIFAPSFYEAAQHFGLPKEEELLEERLIYGNYPQVLGDLEHAELTLRELIQEILFTNLSAHDRINKGDKMMRVLQVLAFHVGDAVSNNEVAERCGLDNETVERYIELLTQANVLIKLPSYHTEQRYELKKSQAIYFTDNGIRNVLISNFNPTFLRNDMDQLWKNYLVSERVKWIRLNGLEKEVYFWKTHTKQQMDFIEIGDGKMMAYKTDWEKRKKLKLPKSFADAYPEAKMSALNRSTYWNFLSRKN